MRRVLLIILLIAGIGSLYSANSIDIPLMVSMVDIAYGDGSTRSTPDPPDPNPSYINRQYLTHRKGCGYEFICSYP